MRCPKCGYISFDRQKSCGKCSNDLTAVAEQLRGTVGKAAAPFFLGAVLGAQTPADTDSTPAPYEEEDTFTLDELEAEAPPTAEEDLDFAGVPLGEDELEDQPLPSLGLEDLDVSDLVPPPEEEQVLSLGSEQEEELQAPTQEAEDSLQGIEFSGFDSEDTLKAEEQEQTLSDFDAETAAPLPDAEDDEIIDLSSLMGFDETPAAPAAPEEEHDVLELSLEEDMDAPAAGDEAKKPPTPMPDIPDLDLTLEDDDR